MAYAVISYDLNNADPSVYDRLNSALKALNFEKLDTDTVWKKPYGASNSTQTAEMVRKDFQRALDQAGHQDFELDVFISAEPIEIIRASGGEGAKAKAVARGLGVVSGRPIR